MEPMKSRLTGIGKAISGVVMFTLLAKVVGFFREIILSYFFGATGISDAYLISQTIPGTIFQFVGTGLLTCFIPIYFKAKNNNDNVEDYTNKILTAVFLFSTFVIIIVWVFTPHIIKFFAYGFEGETFYYAIWFTRIGVLSLYFSSIIYVYNSYLNANNIFITTVLAAIPNSVFIILSIICGARINLWILSIGSTLAVGVQLLFILPSVYRTGYHFKLNFHFKDRYMKSFFSLMGPVVVGVSVNQVNTLIDRTVASQVAIGGISALTDANSLVMFVHEGLAQTVATVCYPQITEAVSLHNDEEAKSLLENALQMLLSLLIPITMGLAMYSSQITEVLFGRGAFDTQAANLTSSAVFFYALGICFLGLREMLTRYYYAFENTRTPMFNTSIGVAVNIILNIILSRVWGVGGLAGATSAAAFVTASLLWIHSRNLPGGIIRLDIKQMIKIFVATVIMLCISRAVYAILQPCTVAVRLFAGILAGGISYLGIALVLKIQVMDFVIQYIKKLKTIMG